VKSLLFTILFIISFNSFANSPVEKIKKLAGTYVGTSHDSDKGSEVCYVEIAPEAHLIGMGDGDEPRVSDNGKVDYDYKTYFEVLEKPDFYVSKNKIVIKYLKPGYISTPLRTTLVLNSNGELEAASLEYKIHFWFEQFSKCTNLVKKN
jgi:hypothetical protein